jgi:hypothetical protein
VGEKVATSHIELGRGGVGSEVEGLGASMFETRQLGHKATSNCHVYLSKFIFILVLDHTLL